MHLLTREAFSAYRRLLSNRGMLLVHITNRYLRLEPVIAAAAAAGGWDARLRIYRPDREAFARNEVGSKWIAMTQSPDTLERFIGGSDGAWTSLKGEPGFRAWTDDHSSVLPLITIGGN